MDDRSERELKEALAASEEKLRLVVESTPAGVAVLDRNLVYIACSRRWVRDYGLDGVQVIGRNHYDVFPEIPERWKEIHRRCLGGVSEECDEDRFERSDGSVQYLRWAIQPWHDSSGEVGGLIFFTEDTTERKRLQEELLQSQKLVSLGTLASGIAHDFNNILAIILGYLPMLEAEREDGQAFGRILGAVRQTIARATGLSQQLLAFGQNTAGNPVALDVAGVLANIVELLSQTLPREITIRADVPAELPFAFLDAGQFQQVLTNLCINARDAMTRGGALTLRASVVPGQSLLGRFPDPRPQDYIRIEVEDTGPGMDEGTMRRAFEPFFTTKEAGRGTGLGLSIVYNIVRQNNGFTEIVSTPGSGTRVVIYLPATQQRPPEESSPTESTSDAVNHRTLLVIEDEEMLREITEWTLSSAGYRVLAAPDGPAGIALFDSNPVDLVVCDLGLPGMAGMAVIETLLARQPSLKVVVASGFIDSDVQERLREWGTKTLQKPYKSQDLLTTVESALDGNR